MKKHITSISNSKWLIYLFIFCCISFLLNYLYSNKNIINEGFETCQIPTSPLPSNNSKSLGSYGFNWKSFYNDTNNNINNLVATNNPNGYYKYNNISNFPDSYTFTGVKNNWNKNIANNTESITNNESNSNDNNYRIVTKPSDFLRFNIISPNCCQYTNDYTSGGGCVCLTPQQTQLLEFRYGNRS